MADAVSAIRERRQNHEREHSNQGAILDFKPRRGEFHTDCTIMLVLLRHHAFVLAYNPLPSRTIEKKLLDVGDGEKRGIGAVVLQV